VLSPFNHRFELNRNIFCVCFRQRPKKDTRQSLTKKDKKKTKKRQKKRQKKKSHFGV